jgi:hypothetical protein
VRKLLLPISVGLLCTSFTIIPASPDNKPGDAHDISSIIAVVPETTSPDAGTALYKNTGLEQYGLSKEAFDYAWKGYQYLVEYNRITCSDYLTICDFSQSSRQKRLYIIDVKNQELVTNTFVAHGKNSGAEFATKFSNTPESLQSSLGFYVTSSTYNGKHGLSLRLLGVDPGFNDKALMRTIVLHGAAYVDAARARNGMYMGRSWGCPAVPQNESTGIINTIKNGTCLFIYHPTRNYLQTSKILNG